MFEGITNGRVRRSLVVALLALVSSIGGIAAAHEFWVEAKPYQLAVGAEVECYLKVGHGADVTVLPRNPARFERFVIVGPEGEKALEGTDGKSPAATARLAVPGLYTIGYRSRHSFVDLEAKEFEAYLKEEGLDHAIEARAARGESASRGRERYSRCAKALVAVGDSPRSGFDRKLGFPLELVAEQDPRDVSAAKESSFQLLQDGKPLKGALIRATRIGSEATSEFNPAKDRLERRSDAEGRVRFPIAPGASWRLNCVVISRVTAAKAATEKSEAPEVEWESLWASLTFEVPAPKAK